MESRESSAFAESVREQERDVLLGIERVEVGVGGGGSLRALPLVRVDAEALEAISLLLLHRSEIDRMLPGALLQLGGHGGRGGGG